MPPGSDVAVQQSAGLTAAQRLSASNPSRSLSVETAGNNKPSEDPPSGTLSARERLRAHVHRNLQIQQEAAQKASEKALAKGEVGVVSASPTSAAALQAGLKSAVATPNGLEQLYAPIEDTRLGVSDISGDAPPKGASPAIPEVLREAAIDMSLDAGGLSRDGGEEEGGGDGGGGFGEGEFLHSGEWDGLEAVDALYYSSGSGGGGKDVVGVDEEWVQGIYDMEGMAPDA